MSGKNLQKSAPHLQWIHNAADIEVCQCSKTLSCRDSPVFLGNSTPSALISSQEKQWDYQWGFTDLQYVVSRCYSSICSDDRIPQDFLNNNVP